MVSQERTCQATGCRTCKSGAPRQPSLCAVHSTIAGVLPAAGDECACDAHSNCLAHVPERARGERLSGGAHGHGCLSTSPSLAPTGKIIGVVPLYAKTHSYGHDINEKFGRCLRAGRWKILSEIYLSRAFYSGSGTHAASGSASGGSRQFARGINLVRGAAPNLVITRAFN